MAQFWGEKARKVMGKSELADVKRAEGRIARSEASFSVPSQALLPPHLLPPMRHTIIIELRQVLEPAGIHFEF